MLQKRGVEIDASTIFRCVQRYAPEPREAHPLGIKVKSRLFESNRSQNRRAMFRAEVEHLLKLLDSSTRANPQDCTADRLGVGQFSVRDHSAGHLHRIARMNDLREAT
jgi:hypothetical protein